MMLRYFWGLFWGNERNWDGGSLKGQTYKRKTAVRAPADLRLVGVDEDARVAERAAAAVARHDAVVCPANGLLVDEVDGRVGAGL